MSAPTVQPARARTGAAFVPLPGGDAPNGEPNDIQSGCSAFQVCPSRHDERSAPRDLSHDAVFALWSRMPEFSARIVVTRPQAAVLLAFCAVLGCAVGLWPHLTAHVLVVCMSAGFMVSITFRTALARIGRGHNRPAPDASACDTMPVYTILVPLYHEAAMLPQLTRALSALDYPKSRLDIKFVTEEDDAETIAAANAWAGALPAEVVIVPVSRPRTKPKACNYALHLARGEYVVVYDAEDRPEPDQLRKAAGTFGRRQGAACLQARLTIDNGRRSWLARMFALDYDLWFKMLLPGLAELRAPIPLGGTSNHFRTRVLQAAGAWDPFNVTEDADLGIRLARLGYGVAMLDSTTFEEAPARFGPWMRQRTRWMKGYMQTLLVHTRRPAHLLNGVGLRGAAAIQFFLGGAVWSALANPVLWMIFAVSCVAMRQENHAYILESLARISGISLLLCNVALAALAKAGTRDVIGVAPSALCYPLYWLLVSAAAYRALWQLFRDPFRWEKTPHEAAADG